MEYSLLSPIGPYWEGFEVAWTALSNGVRESLYWPYLLALMVVLGLTLRVFRLVRRGV